VTTTSGIHNFTGYQGQFDVSTTRTAAAPSFSDSGTKESADSVDISSKAKDLQNEYDQKSRQLKQQHETEVQQLEREYMLEKKQLEDEFTREKQRLQINLYV